MLLRNFRRLAHLTTPRPSLSQSSPNLRLHHPAPLDSGLGTIHSRIQLSQTLQSSTSSSVSVVAVAIFFVAGGSYFYLGQPSEKAHLHPVTALDEPVPAEELKNMPGAALPGRLGNLTSQQEAKLKELWTAVLRVFGVIGLQNGIDESKTLEEADQKSIEKQKKKRVGLFGKKQKNEDSEATDSSVDSANDKWGQTKDFQDVLANQSTEDLRKAYWSMVKHDHPDALLLRFLRARKWDVHNALVMMVATMHWRLQEMHVDDDIMRRGEGGALEDSQSSNAAVKKEGLDFLAQERLGKSFLHGTDKKGRPVCFVRTRLHKQGQESESSLERYTVFVIEHARLMLSPPVDTAAIIFDMTDFSMANMDYSPVKFMIKVFEANYPESLGVVLVHKAPWIFHGIWNIIKGWLDPEVASKIRFTKKVEELEAFIDKSNIIKELGGDDPWEYHFVEPTPGEDDLMKDKVTKQRLLDERADVVRDFERATQGWIKNSQASQQQRTELAERLRSGYWQLDPYLRARSIYDRTGVIVNNEQTHPSNARPAVAEAESTPPKCSYRDDDLD